MPNRILKESICTSESLDSLTSFQETFFYRLLVNCDDYGCMDARPRILAARLYPIRGIGPDEVEETLQALIRENLITIYRVKGKPYLHVTTWEQHQQLRAKKRKFPDPAMADETVSPTDDCNGYQMKSDDSNGNHLPASCARAESESESNPNINPNQNQKPNQTPKPTCAPARGGTDADDRFTAFWNEYPKHVAKQDALKAWRKLRPDGALMDRLMTALATCKKSDEWTREDGRFIPHPATWLNGHRWEDEVPPPSRAVPFKPKVIAQDYEQRDYSAVDEELIVRQNAEMEKFLRENPEYEQGVS